MMVFKASVMSVLLYGAETWNVMRTEVRMLEVFYLRCLRRILGVSAYHDRIRNEEVLRRTGMPDMESVEAEEVEVVWACAEDGRGESAQTVVMRKSGRKGSGGATRKKVVGLDQRRSSIGVS